MTLPVSGSPFSRPSEYHAFALGLGVGACVYLPSKLRTAAITGLTVGGVGTIARADEVRREAPYFAVGIVLGLAVGAVLPLEVLPS